ncbi:hypothetical protein GCM10010210_55360 [Pseudonocardia hydrocarbonoxydans]|uniref:Uncharacterized protein n=1 Tax=Pseudonocardia hydrocarbonoxydans TaxID=76726 RepID=A0A4Y3WNC8_9PSEU|nr:hypothetical protein PHY01_18430 [Pseudonocardia hydrocarbonoxydans]
MLAAGTITAVAYAGGPSRDTAGIHGCVQQRTGALRVVDPARGQGCRTGHGYFAEYAVTLSQAAGLPGPAGPRGPRGPAGGGIESLDDLEGLPCNEGSADEGVVDIRILPPEQGSQVLWRCLTDRTVTTAPTPQPTLQPTPTMPEGTPDPSAPPPMSETPPTTAPLVEPTTSGASS